ncbi:MAG: UvrD-helicase domain-containing protein [Alphaproteobacteria bacterium]
MQEATAIEQHPSPSYLDGLNAQQREAVEATEGPVLVLAGAGTGKTRVLTTRIAHILMTKRAFPSQVLAVTFTNKAAAEMRGRVAGLLFGDANGKETASLWLGTFHSTGAKILRRHAELVGLTPQFTILDSDDQERLLKAILAEQNIDHTRFPARAVNAVIQSWKDRGLTFDKIKAEPGNYTLEQVAAKLYPIYQNRLRALNCVDFGDLLLHNLTIFTAHPNVLETYASRFRYILVDEYQDTNTAQYLWLRLLAAYHKNLCCVGDDDQSIYGWRGAEVGNILKFEHDYPGAKIIRLERNYRSTAPILAAASGLIANNAGRLGKTLWTDATGGHPVRIKSIWDDNEEARFVAEEIEAFQRDKTSLKEMAVLVRAGYQTRAFEERFMTLAIPYKVIGGLRFYERMEIRDAIAYLRIVAQPHDDLALERVINTPKRGIGKATMELLHVTARARNESLYAAIQHLLGVDALKGKTGATLAKLLGQFERWRSRLSDLPLAELADLMLEESGYRAMWQADKSPEAAGRVENLRELVRALTEFPSLAEFLEHVGLVTEGTEQASGDMVNIMTLHAAKGLEFDVVFLTGWEEGLFPSQRTMDELGNAGLEEERRLAYVGITRAKKHLTLSHAANRRIYNQWQSSVPSRFLGEIPAETVEFLDGGPYARRASGPALFQKEVESILAGRVIPSPRRGEDGRGASQSSAQSSPHPNPPPAGEGMFAKGARVFHQKFGNGVILGVEGDHLEIAFKHAGIKKILAEYVEEAPA